MFSGCSFVGIVSIKKLSDCLIHPMPFARLVCINWISEEDSTAQDRRGMSATTVCSYLPRDKLYFDDKINKIFFLQTLMVIIR